MSNGTSGCSKELGRTKDHGPVPMARDIRGDLLQLKDEVGRDDALRVALTAIELGARAARAAASSRRIRAQKRHPNQVASNNRCEVGNKQIRPPLPRSAARKP
jgi:hypothetical protein